MYMYVVQQKESGTKEGKKKQTQRKKTAKSESPDQVILTKSQMLQLTCISIYFFCLILSKKCKKCKRNWVTHGAPRSSQELIQKCPCIPGLNWNLEMLVC